MYLFSITRLFLGPAHSMGAALLHRKVLRRGSTVPFATNLLAVALCCVSVVPAGADAPGLGQNNGVDTLFEQLRGYDMRLAAVGYRLVVANAPLCDRLEPGIGMQLHALDQYDVGERDAAQAHFGFETPIGVEGVIAGSPADAAGVRPDDSLVRVGPVVIADISGKPGTTERLVGTQLAIAALPPDQPIDVDLLRHGAPMRVTVHPVPACFSRFELKVSDTLDASGDGTMVQVSSRALDDFAGDLLVPLVAHELSHNILRHRERLEARGVSWGMLAGLGGNVKYFRQVETEADILSVSLMANAGYDPAIAVPMLRQVGKQYSIFSMRTHPHWKDRIATVEHEIAVIKTHRERPIIPSVLASRERPLDGDWKAILKRH